MIVINMLYFSDLKKGHAGAYPSRWIWELPGGKLFIGGFDV
jgi:hypothetical protein